MNWPGMRWWRSHTVRVRLALWYVVTMTFVLGVYVFLVYTFVSRNALQNLDQELRRDFNWAAATVDVSANGRVFMQNQPQLVTGDEELPWVQVWTGDGKLRLFMTNEAIQHPVPASTELAGFPEGDPVVLQSLPVQGEQTTMRLLTRRQPIRDEPYIIQVGRSEEPMRRERRQLLAILALGVPVAIAVAGLGGYVLARRALRPIERMTERAQHITAERLDERLPVHNPDDEMGRLAAVFNNTLARLEESFEQMRRFTADVSHELRTPLTAIRSVGEVGLRGNRDAPAYRGIIGSMLEEADRLASLVDRLLTLSRAETGVRKNPREPLDLSQLADDVAAHLGVLAEEKGQSIVVERHGAALVTADRLGLRQAVINLVDNAIKFTPSGGRIRLIVRDRGEDATLDVVDSGPGIPDVARAHIFERFFRAAPAGAAGTGLGLSIAKGAVDGSGGRLTLEASGAGGSTFRIALPRAAGRGGR